MSVGFVGNVFIDGSKIQNVDISNSTIANSFINMNNRNITFLADPLVPLDAANKNYVDKIGINTTVSLLSTLSSVIYSGLIGSYNIKIENNFGGPIANYTLSKSISTLKGHVVRNSSSPSLTLNQLNIQYNTTSGITLNKILSSDNGVYNIKIT